jgi:hypothetical protein
MLMIAGGILLALAALALLRHLGTIIIVLLALGLIGYLMR